MLQNIRDNSKGIIAYILIGFLVLLFAISGIEILFNWNFNADRAAKVNGEAVTKNELERAISNQISRLLNQYGSQLPEQYQSPEYWRSPVLDNLIRQKLLLGLAKKQNMAVSASAVEAELMADPGLKNEQGQFDQVKYQQFLRMQNLTHAEFIKMNSEAALLDQIQTGVVSSSFLLPYELDQAVALGFQSRDINYFQIPVNQLRDSIEVSESEIQAEYQANPKAYTVDEQVAVDYIELRSADLVSSVSFTEEQLRQQYEQNVANFVAAPERQAAHILIEGDKPDLVKEIAGKIAAGEDFAGLAKTYSEDLANKDQGGDLGFTDGSIFPKEFEEALATLQVGQVSGAVKTEAGTHFIKLLAERGGSAPTFEEQRSAIEQQLKLAEAENLFLAQLEKLKEETYNAEKLGDVAPGLGLTVKNTGLFARTNGKEIAANPKFVEAAFSDDVLQEGNASEPVELEPSHVVVIKKTEHQPAHLKPLAEVQEQIVALLKDKKARELLAQKSQDYIKQIQSGQTSAQVAQAAGYELKEVKGATRSSADVDMELLRHAFSMAKPLENKSSISGISLANGDYAVISVLAVTNGDKSQLPLEQQTALTAQLSNMIGQQNFANFQKALEDSAEIERN